MKNTKFTKGELKLINDTLEGLVAKKIRPIVLLGLAAHCIGFTSYTSGASVDALMEVVKGSVEFDKIKNGHDKTDLRPA